MKSKKARSVRHKKVSSMRTVLKSSKAKKPAAKKVIVKKIEIPKAGSKIHNVIIGNSAAGIAAAEAIRSNDKNCKITMISSENYPVYSRCLLSYYIAGDITEEKLLYREKDFYNENNLVPMIGKKVEKVMPDKNILLLSDKSRIPYDNLLIATGSRPHFPDIEGIKTDGVFGVRTVEDAKKIMKKLENAKAAVIIGGGLIGTKTAYALSKRGLKIFIIIKSNRVLSQMIDLESASIFRKKMELNGINIMTGADAVKIISKNGKVAGVELDNGKNIECGIVVVGKGVTVNKELVLESGIETDAGIITDKMMKTNIKNIFAAGDVAESVDVASGECRINALWPIAFEEGRIAGLNMTGMKKIYERSIGMNSLQFFGINVVSMGIVNPASGAGYETLVDDKREFDSYRKLVLKDNMIKGYITVGDIKNSGVYLDLIRKKINISSVKELLLENSFDFAKVSELVGENEEN